MLPSSPGQDQDMFPNNELHWRVESRKRSVFSKLRLGWCSWSSSHHCGGSQTCPSPQRMSWSTCKKLHSHSVISSLQLWLLTNCWHDQSGVAVKSTALVAVKSNLPEPYLFHLRHHLESEIVGHNHTENTSLYNTQIYWNAEKNSWTTLWYSSPMQCLHQFRYIFLFRYNLNFWLFLLQSIPLHYKIGIFELIFWHPQAGFNSQKLDNW